MASNSNRNNDSDFGSWLYIVIMMMVFWPVGLFLLIRKLMDSDWSSAARKASAAKDRIQTSASAQKKRARAPKGGVPDRGRGLIIAGSIVTGIFGTAVLAMLSEFVAYGFLSDLEGLFPCLGLLATGIVLLTTGLSRRKAAKRMRRYLPLIGKRNEVSIDTLAQVTGRSAGKVRDDLQDMLDAGILPTGYLDLNRGMLVLGDEGVQEPVKPEPEEEKVAAESDVSEENRILMEIRTVNDDIDDPEMSRKIDRIGEIASKIFAYQKQNPGKDAQLRSFLSYYLPTTLKILRAYAQMEEQGVEGENIHAAKKRIEGMMDKVVEGFEKQLDRLFQDKAMDVSTDVEVLERMLEKDGLSGGAGMTL